MKHVKIKRHVLLPTGDVADPGTVVSMEDQTADDFIRRRLGEPCESPPSEVTPTALAAVHPTPAHKAAANA